MAEPAPQVHDLAAADADLLARAEERLRWLVADAEADDECDPPTLATSDRGLKCLTDLVAHERRAGRRLAEPFIGLEPDGTVSLDWRSGPDLLILAIREGPPTVLHRLRTHPDRAVTTELFEKDPSTERIADAVRALFGS